jgi:hypothetical protein
MLQIDFHSSKSARGDLQGIAKRSSPESHAFYK